MRRSLLSLGRRGARPVAVPHASSLWPRGSLGSLGSRGSLVCALAAALAQACSYPSVQPPVLSGEPSSDPSAVADASAFPPFAFDARASDAPYPTAEDAGLSNASPVAVDPSGEVVAWALSAVGPEYVLTPNEVGAASALVECETSCAYGGALIVDEGDWGATPAAAAAGRVHMVTRGGIAVLATPDGVFVNADVAGVVPFPVGSTWAAAAVTTVAMDDTSVYLGNSVEAMVWRCPLDGCPVTGATAFLSSVVPTGIALSPDGERAVITGMPSDGSVVGQAVACSTENGTCAPSIVVGATNTAGFAGAIDSEGTAWTRAWTLEGNGARVPASGSVFTCASAACASGGSTEIASGRDTPVGVAVDAAYVYWSEIPGGVAGSTGSVYRCPRGGCERGPEAVVVNQPAMSGQIAVGPLGVYWDSAGSLYYLPL